MSRREIVVKGKDGKRRSVVVTAREMGRVRRAASAMLSLGIPEHAVVNALHIDRAHFAEIINPRPWWAL